LTRRRQDADNRPAGKTARPAEPGAGLEPVTRQIGTGKVHLRMSGIRLFPGRTVMTCERRRQKGQITMRVFTVLGPTQSGKSTLVAALAALEGRAIQFDVAGVVRLHEFDYMDEAWTAIDVDGGADALAYAGPAIAISDAVVLCVPPDPDAAVLSAPYMRLIEASGVPCFLFINRMDSPNGRIRDIVGSLQGYARHHITLRQIPIRDGDRIIGAVDLISERAWKYQEGQPSALIEIPKSEADREHEARAELLEELSDYDDHLLEQLIEDKQPPSADLYHLAADVLQHHELIPACIGAASHHWSRSPATVPGLMMTRWPSPPLPTSRSISASWWCCAP
jgi:translation elongation factor EF-G